MTHRRPRVTALLCLLLALALTACASAAPRPLPEVPLPERDAPLRLAVATDLHYLSRRIVRDGEAFHDAWAYGDGKLINYIPELTEVFVRQLLDDPPDGVLITGDLTLNGERVSHLELAEKLLPLRQAGIPVLVIPGNHDIANAFAAGYNRDKTYSVRTIMAEEFAEIYSDFGYGGAVSRDTASLSYVYPLSAGLWAVMLDTNRYDREGAMSIPDNAGSLPAETLVWLTEQLKAAKARGVTVITATHHGLLDHSERLRNGYTLDNAAEVRELLAQYRVPLNLSGHIHVQDAAREGDFFDIATSSMAVYTNQYGEITYRPGESLRYRSRELDVEGWAARTGSQDPDLLNFEQWSYDFFYEVSYLRSWSNLYQAQLNGDADLDLMAQTMAILNPAYFSGYAGRLREEILASDHYAMWKAHSGFAPIGYINSMLAPRELDPRDVTIPLG